MIPGNKYKTGDFNHCIRCGTTDNDKFRKWVIDEKNFIYVICRDCHSGAISAIPDVWYGYGSGTHSEENIAYPHGHPLAGQPIPFSDKRSKKAAMDLAGVREAGDRVRGVRDESMVPKNRKRYI